MLREHDIILTYWSRSADRQADFVIPAHLTNDRIIVVDDRQSGTVDLTVDAWSHVRAAFDSAYGPFRNEAWAVLILCGLFNALALYLLEWDHDDLQARTHVRGYGLALFHSVAMLPGATGFQPKTVAGKTIFCLWGIVVVVSVAWYTGDLAGSQAAEAFTQSIKTIPELRTSGRKVCYTVPVRADGDIHVDVLQEEIRHALLRAELPAQAVSVKIGLSTSQKILEMESAMLEENGCGAMVVPRNGYANFIHDRSVEGACDAHPQHALVESLLPNGAGWAVSLNVSGCVQPSLDWAFTQLNFVNGTDVMASLEDILVRRTCASGASGANGRVGLVHVGFLYYVYAAVWLLVLLPALAKFFAGSFLERHTPDIIMPVHQDSADAYFSPLSRRRHAEDKRTSLVTQRQRTAVKDLIATTLDKVSMASGRSSMRRSASDMSTTTVAPPPPPSDPPPVEAASAVVVAKPASLVLSNSAVSIASSTSGDDAGMRVLSPSTVHVVSRQEEGGGGLRPIPAHRGASSSALPPMDSAQLEHLGAALLRAMSELSEADVQEGSLGSTVRTKSGNNDIIM